MSGGEWNYFHRRFVLELESFCEDIKERFPLLASKLLAKGKIVCEIINDIDYDVSGDETIPNDSDFQRKSIEKLKDDN
ncbi:MAG: hypothetical protein FJ264_10640 [Planctomycetes bacterium]|nr:hypothetical protein [Planctomycetota bacterium]